MSRPNSGIVLCDAVHEESPESIFSIVAEMMPEEIALPESGEAAATGSATESEIAALAYQLWLANGRRDGWDLEDWLRAEAMLRNAIVSKFEDLQRGPSIPRDDASTDSEVLVEYRWEGHWEVWESEWGGARWSWDLVPPSVDVPNRAG